MFRELRRSKQLLPDDETKKVLAATSTGILAVLGDQDYPYAVPINFAYEENKIYFHCAKKGTKWMQSKICS